MALATCATCQAPLTEGAQFCSQCGTPTPTGVTARSQTAAAPEKTIARLARALGPKYEVRRLLGAGGFAEVFEVWDTDLARRLAVKVLRPDIAWSAGMLERFRQEARSLATLSHPNILPIHFVGDAEGLAYYAMPFIEGQSLAEFLRRSGALDVNRALGIIRPVLEALNHAHSLGLIHRDIKPDNIMLENSSGRVMLVDFGIAKQVGGSATNLTQTGFVVGTPYYMSPEQALGQGDVDNRTDIYAVGAMLFQMVTGAPPFEGDSSQEIVGKHLSEPVPVPASVNTRIPVWLSDVILRCLAKRAADRFQNCGQVLSALDAGRESGGSQAISAERVAARIKADDVTAAMPTPVPAPIGTSVPTVKTVAARPPAPAPVPTRSGVRPAILVAGVVVLLAGLMVFRWMTRPILTIENRLADPVRITWNSSSWELKPGERREFAIPRRRPLVAQWYLEQPTCPDGSAMGLALQGTIAVEHPSGRIHRNVDMWSAEKPAFAPLITNASDQSLVVRVNAGLQGGEDLRCRVTPGANRVHIGYYPLFGNSSVEVTAPDGRKASFRDLGAQVTDRLAGTLGLSFASKDLQ
ncbi:MAG TPA: serine/threonine-protein kinase [Gemmatimonadales bacterium]|nr:serine/threonine-protein kinase [Gemmatimonadales bacterium]